jgi:polar amino acid transport system permease protein
MAESSIETPQKIYSNPARRVESGWFMLVAVIALIVILVLTQPDLYGNMLRFMSDGICVTIFVTIISFVIVLVVGLIGGLGRTSKNWLFRGITTIYVEVIRGIPVMVQLLYWYFAMPAIIQELGRALTLVKQPVIASIGTSLSGYQTNPIVMAIIGLVVCYGAYMSEVVRAGIQSITKGQMEAARSLGMTSFQAMWHIILPQAFRVILPAIGNEFITLLKDSSLVSVVAVADLTRRAREFNATYFKTIPVWSMVALLYLVMTLLSSRLVSFTEKISRTDK